jgi:hypothetical protein
MADHEADMDTSGGQSPVRARRLVLSRVPTVLSTKKKQLAILDDHERAVQLMNEPHSTYVGLTCMSAAASSTCPPDAP